MNQNWKDTIGTFVVDFSLMDIDQVVFYWRFMKLVHPWAYLTVVDFPIQNDLAETCFNPFNLFH